MELKKTKKHKKTNKNKKNRKTIKRNEVNLGHWAKRKKNSMLTSITVASSSIFIQIFLFLLYLFSFDSWQRLVVHLNFYLCILVGVEQGTIWRLQQNLMLHFFFFLEKSPYVCTWSKWWRWHDYVWNSNIMRLTPLLDKQNFENWKTNF